MTFTTPTDGQAAVAEHIAQLTEDLSGVRSIPVTINTLTAGALTVSSTLTVNGTVGSNFRFSPDNTYDIGGSSTTLRPRNIYAASSINADSVVGVTSVVSGSAAAGSNIVASTISTGSSYGGDLNFYVAQANRWKIVNSGHLAPAANITYDIGGQPPYMVRDLYLGRTLYQGTAAAGNQPLIRNPVNDAAKTTLSIEAPAASANFSSKTGSSVNGNAYHDGSNWMRFDVAAPATVFQATGSGAFNWFTAPAGANPATLTQRMSLDTSGNLNVAGSITGASLSTPLQVRLVGWFFSGVTFSSSLTTPVGTPISVAATILGNKTLHITYTLSITSNTAGMYVYTGLGWAGANQHMLTLLYVPVANQTIPTTGSYYIPKGTLAAGTYTFQVFMQTGGGTMTMSPNIESTIAVLELND